MTSYEMLTAAAVLQFVLAALAMLRPAIMSAFGKNPVYYPPLGMQAFALFMWGCTMLYLAHTQAQ